MTTTDQPATNVEQLLEDAWTLDCAIRLREPTWAAATAEQLVARLARHEQDAIRAWNGVDNVAGVTLAAEARAVRVALLPVAAGLDKGAVWPRPDVSEWIETLIHHEAVAVADVAWGLVD